MAILLDQGCEKSVVILTRPRGYQKGADKTMPIMKRKYKEYPKYVAAAGNRQEEYNRTLELVADCEETGQAFVISPSRDLGVSRTEKNIEKLKRMYKLGRFDAQQRMEEILAYVKG